MSNFTPIQLQELYGIWKSTAKEVKKGDNVYRLYNRIESHRKTSSKHDPVYYEYNDRWDNSSYTDKQKKDFTMWAFSMSRSRWEQVNWANYEKAKTPEVNEWGEVSP